MYSHLLSLARTTKRTDCLDIRNPSESLYIPVWPMAEVQVELQAQTAPQQAKHFSAIATVRVAASMPVHSRSALHIPLLTALLIES